MPDTRPYIFPIKYKQKSMFENMWLNSDFNPQACGSPMDLHRQGDLRRVSNGFRIGLQ